MVKMKVFSGLRKSNMHRLSLKKEQGTFSEKMMTVNEYISHNMVAMVRFLLIFHACYRSLESQKLAYFAPLSEQRGNVNRSTA